jgi:nucleotide-binding universal stress UspA family protein
MMLFKTKDRNERLERAVQKTIDNVRAQRRKRFRILACVRDADDDFSTVRMAAQLAPSVDCDIIIVYVRPIDQGLWSGGLQLKLARQNMLDAGLELPGLKLLKEALEALKEEGIDTTEWERKAGHQDAWGDPAGDNKVEFRSEDGRSVVLKLKTAPDPASGILDQYELGPYNLILLGEPSRWRGEVKSWFGTGVVQRVTVLSPASVLVVRQQDPAEKPKRGFFICTTGTARCMQAVRRSAVLAHSVGEPITLFSAARSEADLKAAKEHVKTAKALLTAIGIKVKKTQTAVGDPVEKICEHGSNHKIIVVSDEGRSHFFRMINPSVAYGVVRSADTSVMDVR